jgi:hypothetical protein
MFMDESIRSEDMRFSPELVHTVHKQLATQVNRQLILIRAIRGIRG